MNGNFPASCRLRATALSARYGEINAVIAILEASAKSFATCKRNRVEGSSVRRNRGYVHPPRQAFRTRLADATNVLIAILFREAEVFVESEADVVAVEAVGELAEMKQMLLERGGDRRL